MSIRRMSDFVRSQPPITLSARTSVRKACQVMRDNHVGAILVTDQKGRLAGIFTGRDAVGRVVAEGKDCAKTKLSEVMTANPRTMAPGATAIDALRLMQDGHFRHVPVSDAGTIVGIVSHGDFRGLELDRLDEETGIWERL